MTIAYSTPGVYIQELTGPGVIAGVGTSTAAFLGPAVVGPIGVPQLVTTYDDYVRVFGTLPDGTVAPYIPGSKRFYLTSAVRGFFDNGGTLAYILRVGTAKQATWAVTNQKNETAFLVQATAPGAAGNGLTVGTSAANLTGATGVAAATASATVAAVDGTGTLVTVNNAGPFRVGDVVTGSGAGTAAVARVNAATNQLTLQAPIAGLKAGDALTLADLTPATAAVRLANPADAQNLYPGSVVLIQGKDSGGVAVQDYALVAGANSASGVVTLATSIPRTKTFHFPSAAPVLISQEFNLSVTPAGGAMVTYANLSLNPGHPYYVLRAVPPGPVAILPPAAPPTANYPQALVTDKASFAESVTGVDDAPGSLSPDDYQAGLDILKDVEGVNIVCIPDAASHPSALSIQQAMIAHCFDPDLRDRVAVLDSLPGVAPSGIGSVLDQRGAVQSPSGFAALYYPWLAVRDPSSPPNNPATMTIPPCGHIAGLYAQTDATVGVHKAPANVEVANVLGLERVLSGRQQGPLNDAGVNVLRIFPGTGAVNVWGARTTVDPAITDWRYVSTRRLLIYIEQSLKAGLRPSVFQPNNPSLWASLTREIEEFLARVWQAGALFGAKADQAFYVRIDAGNNPPSVQALGQLFVEIGVRPSYPAEFVIVQIGLWDGGAQVAES